MRPRWSGFLRGFTSILGTSPAPRRRVVLPTAGRTDAEALAEDWARVLGDLERAVEKAVAEKADSSS